jgi:hypothetical protein
VCLTGVPSGTSYCCINSYPAISVNLSDEVVNLLMFTVGLTLSGC